MVRNRGKRIHIQMVMNGQKVGVGTPAQTKREAEKVEAAIKRAIRIGDAPLLDPVEHEVCKWMKPIVITLYLTGMRRGEVV